MSAEAPNPHWKERVQAIISDYWGNTKPIPLREATRCPIYDVTGRPAVESQILTDIVGLPHDFKPVPYKDQRVEGIANMEAYEATARDFKATISLIGAIRQSIQPYGKAVNVERLAEVVHACIMFPNWLVLRSDNPVPNGEVPPAVAGLVRVGRGLMKLYIEPIVEGKLDDYFDREKYGSTEADLKTAEGTLDVITRKRSLTEPGTNVVCPAPTTLIEQTVFALHEEPDGIDTIFEELGLEDVDLKRVKKLGFANKTITTINEFLRLAQMRVVRETPPDAIQRRLEALVKPELSRLNHAQRWVDQSLLRESTPSLTLEDLKPSGVTHSFGFWPIDS